MYYGCLHCKNAFRSTWKYGKITKILWAEKGFFFFCNSTTSVPPRCWGHLGRRRARARLLTAAADNGGKRIWRPFSRARLPRTRCAFPAIKSPPNVCCVYTSLFFILSHPHPSANNIFFFQPRHLFTFPPRWSSSQMSFALPPGTRRNGCLGLKYKYFYKRSTVLSTWT